MQKMLLAELETRMGAIDLAACTEAELSGLVADLDRGRRRIEGYLAQVATEARHREDTSGGAPPPDDLFRKGGRVSRNEAGRLAKRGRVAKDFPKTADKMHAGDVLTENMDTLARAVAGLNDQERSRLAALDHELADRAMTLPPETFARWLRKLIASVRDEERPSTAEQQRAASTLRMGRRADGMWWLAAEFDHERGAELSAAIEAAARKYAAGEHAGGTSSVTANTRAAALHLLATRTGDGGSRGCLGIGYVIDAQTLFHGPHPGTVSQTWGGDDHDPKAVQRLACDSDWYAVVINRLGHPDATGLTRRAASREQRLALRALYPHCPLDGTPFDQCEIHHVNQPVEHGGRTALDNLVPISVAWHHRIHDRGWTLTMAPDRSLELKRPDGTHDRTVPPPQPLTRQRE